MSKLVRNLIAQTLPLPPAALKTTLERHTRKIGVHVGTEHRDALRALLMAAALTESTATLAFIKKGGDLRYMAAKPIAPVDKTDAYYTVIDLEKTEAADDGEPRYRRVRLDTVVSMQLHYAAA